MSVDVNETLQRLEEGLLGSEVRHDAQTLSSLLADEFREIGSSGRMFSKAEIIRLLQTESPVHYSLHGFQILPIADHAFLATYRAVKQAADVPPTESLRSSIWILRGGRWQMLFHQGTLLRK